MMMRAFFAALCLALPAKAEIKIQEVTSPGGITAWLGETAILSHQGTEVPMSQLIMAYRGADGQVEYLWSILRDVSESGAAEAALMLDGWASGHRSAYDQRYYRTWMHELPPMQHIQRGTVLDVHHAIAPLMPRAPGW